ncbi:preprotein translocase subunit SecE [bacterium]|nr:preprotein translocase subunit SecE [bacterium]
MAKSSKKKHDQQGGAKKGKDSVGPSASSGAASVSVADLPQFFRESVGELKKVTTPTRQETIQATIVTIIIMVFIALCLFFLDFLFGNLMESVLG